MKSLDEIKRMTVKDINKLKELQSLHMRLSGDLKKLKLLLKPMSDFDSYEMLFEMSVNGIGDFTIPENSTKSFLEFLEILKSGYEKRISDIENELSKWKYDE